MPRSGRRVSRRNCRLACGGTPHPLHRPCISHCVAHKKLGRLQRHALQTTQFPLICMCRQSRAYAGIDTFPLPYMRSILSQYLLNFLLFEILFIILFIILFTFLKPLLYNLFILVRCVFTPLLLSLIVIPVGAKVMPRGQARAQTACDFGRAAAYFDLSQRD